MLDNDHPKVGFTGTRRGMTPIQRVQLERVLRDLEPTELHHGCAVGADAEAHEIALLLGISSIVVHPSTLTAQLADVRRADDRCTVVVLAPKKPLRRNRAIVRAVDILVAAPASAEEVERSGTWSTVRFARRCLPNVRVIVIPPT